MKFRLETVKSLINFIREFNEIYPNVDYEVFDGNCGDLLLKIYDYGNIEVYVCKDKYEVVFSD